MSEYDDALESMTDTSDWVEEHYQTIRQALEKAKLFDKIVEAQIRGVDKALMDLPQLEEKTNITEKFAREE